MSDKPAPRKWVRIQRFVLDWNGNELEWQALPGWGGMTVEQLVEFIHKLTEEPS